MFPVIRALSLPALYMAVASSLLSAQDKPTQGADSAPKVESNHAVQLDAEHRVITAGGFVKSGPIVFQDISEKAGLNKWTHHMGTPTKDYIIETKGSGVCLIDYDNDGWLDIYIVNGSTLEALAGKASAPHAALFHNNHDGTFTDISAKAGVQNDRWGMGCAVADYDNDGYPDLYVSNFGKNRLYHNNKNGTFTDMAGPSNVTLGNWSTGVTWGDYDGDGKVDLFVAGYLHWDWDNPPAKGGEGGSSNSFCTFRGEATACGPRGLKGEPDHLFHNNGDGTFTDVSEKAGVGDKPGYYGLGAVFVDINNDGKPDLLVGNDSTPNYLYINKGDGTFEDDSYASGYALNEAGRETASMGIAVGDTQNKGMLDVFNTTFSDDYKPLYRNEGDANFTDVSYHIGLGEVTVPFLSWGDAFFDYDNDGWKDLMMSDGHVYPQADKYNWGTSWKERPMLFHNLQGKSFENVPAVEGTGLAAVIAGRGMAVGDLFNDGKIDAVINVMDGHPVLLRNVDPNRNHWVELKLTGSGKTPRDATGTVVYLTAGGVKQRGDVISGGSYLSNNDTRLHFGLGVATKIDDIEIHWPDGKVQHATAALDKITPFNESK
ncbi:MAG: CRTAC1 family protein [Acidobacteria bacterium]|nr:CRTAC1 family protein [Acidobacteriota bacterium]